MGERTGSRVFQWVWSYVLRGGIVVDYIVRCLSVMLPATVSEI
ncbi:hypothetical protein CTRU02_205947 [Colletotrichum truncatum]|uniref:Uncharacterized protein n=1 Tax=Colletotrichum truncatum TaxID=5467 RepID=A0ACC3Z5F9_COLTU